VIRCSINILALSLALYVISCRFRGVSSCFRSMPASSLRYRFVAMASLLMWRELVVWVTSSQRGVPRGA